MTTKSETSQLDRLVRTAIEEVNKGSITLKDVLSVLAPDPEKVEVPAVLPVPQKITEEQQRAVERVTEVFGKVIPTERRTLTPQEVAALADEKATLDEIKKMAESRQGNIRTTIFNHLDIEAEDQGVTEGVLQNGDGHYLIGGEVRGEASTPHKFTRQISNHSPSVSADALKKLSEDEDSALTHQDYLAMTTPVRVLDENKVMLALKKNPQLITELAKVIQKGSKTASMYLRKA